MCDKWNSCTVTEGVDFTSVFIGAHEMGHSLGMSHDEPYCSYVYLLVSAEMLIVSSALDTSCQLHLVRARRPGRDARCATITHSFAAWSALLLFAVFQFRSLTVAILQTACVTRDSRSRCQSPPTLYPDRRTPPTCSARSCTAAATQR